MSSTSERGEKDPMMRCTFFFSCLICLVFFCQKIADPRIISNFQTYRLPTPNTIFFPVIFCLYDCKLKLFSNYFGNHFRFHGTWTTLHKLISLIKRRKKISTHHNLFYLRSVDGEKQAPFLSTRLGYQEAKIALVEMQRQSRQDLGIPFVPKSERRRFE